MHGLSYQGKVPLSLTVSFPRRTKKVFCSCWWMLLWSQLNRAHTIHLRSEANPLIQDKAPSSLGLKEDSPDLGSSPTHTHRTGAAAAALAPDLSQVLLPLPISDSVRSSGRETTFPSAGLISYLHSGTKEKKKKYFFWYNFIDFPVQIQFQQDWMQNSSTFVLAC